MKKRQFIVIVLIMLLVVNSLMVYGISDSSIKNEIIANTYTGKDRASYIIKNIQFNDVASSYWGKEPITRLGALEVIKGHADGDYRPREIISNEEVLTLLVRAIGQEEQALVLAEQLEISDPTNESLTTIWSKGYLNVASNIGLITRDNFDDALLLDQSQLNPEFNFIRKDGVTREQVAKWLVDAIATVNPNAIVPINNPQAILNYADYEAIGVSYAPYVEAVIDAKIMVGSNNRFNPKDNLTRAEMAQILTNIDNVLYESMQIEQKAGTILHIHRIENDEKDFTENITEFYVRTPDGNADKIVYKKEKNLTGIVTTYDAPVFIRGYVKNLLALREGDYIEYLVEGDNVVYVTATDHNTKSAASGLLRPFTNIEQGEISISDAKGNITTFIMDNNLYDVEDNTVIIDGIPRKLDETKTGYEVALTLLNGLVTDIRYTDAIYMDQEYSGIVKEHDTVFSYLTIQDWNGTEKVFSYYRDTVEVEKQQYYDEYDEIGYIDELFPTYRFDEKDTTIDRIEPGDIVHIQLDDEGKIYRISAKTNYIVKHGQVKNIVHEGASRSVMTVAFDDGSVQVLPVDNSVNVLKDDRVIGRGGIVAGDVVKLLMNEAVVAPGTLSRSVKEINVDSFGNEVSNIYKGKWGVKEDAQQTLSLFHGHELLKTGWEYTGQMTELDVSNQQIQCFYENQQISLDYANRFLNKDDMEVYVITSEYYGDERVERIVLREGRDTVLNPSKILAFNGINEVKTVDYVAPINLDKGTIVIKNNKLVEATSIIPPDYSRIILNGNNKAAIINIEAAPNNDALTVFRGRIASIDDGKSFEVTSHATLNDMEWVYSPVARTYEIAYDTIITDESGAEIAFTDFVDYGEISKVDEVYTVIAEGTKAEYIVKNDFAKNGAFGEIYGITDKDISIKDTLVYTEEDKKWQELDLSNSYATINLLDNSIIIKKNKLITASELEKGDQITVLTPDNLTDELLNNGARDADGVVVLVR